MRVDLKAGPPQAVPRVAKPTSLIVIPACSVLRTASPLAVFLALRLGLESTRPAEAADWTIEMVPRDRRGVDHQEQEKKAAGILIQLDVMMWGRVRRGRDAGRTEGLEKSCRGSRACFAPPGYLAASSYLYVCISMCSDGDNEDTAARGPSIFSSKATSSSWFDDEKID